MPRIALPKNYLLDEGILLEGFENALEWSNSVGTIEEDTINFKSGTKSLKLTSPEGSLIRATKTVSLNLNPSKINTLKLWLYLYSEPVDVGAITLAFSPSATEDLWVSISMVAGTTIHKGENLVVLSPGDFSGDTDYFNSTILRLRINVSAQPGKTAVCSVDDLRYGFKAIPKLLITFDDAKSSVYDEAFPYMEGKGLKGTIYVNSAKIDTEGYMTTAQCDEMYAAGWAMGNHAANHVNLKNVTEAEMISELQICTDWLLSCGYAKSAYHVAYPYGGYNSTVLSVLKSLNMRTGRATTAPVKDYLLPDDMYLLRVKEILDTHSLANVKTFIDTAITKQATLILLFHMLGETASGYTWATSDFQALVDYIISRKISVVTIDEWYQGLMNPRMAV
jgi:peptidoglycan/xylan/chitin deacetylase (PgdA/CDA1 family)